MEQATEPSSEAHTEKKIFSLPILPVKNAVCFPYLFMPFSAGRPISVAAIEAAFESEDKMLVLVTQKETAVDFPKETDLYSIGTRAVIKKKSNDENKVDLLVQGLDKVVLLRLEQMQPYLKGRVQILPTILDSSIEVEALQRAVSELAFRILQISQAQIPANILQLLDRMQDPLQLAYLLTSMLGLDFQKEQAILEANSTLETLRLLYRDMSHEFEVLELRHRIASTARTEIDKEQRDYLLRQQLRAIQQELGEGSEKAELDELHKKIEEANLPSEPQKEVYREFNRLQKLPAIAPDYQVIRSHLDFLLELPWNKTTDDVIDLKSARKILDDDHFDLEDVKDRILEHLAVFKMNPKAKAPIFCFVGPPGVGKTSLGQSIARSLGRKFERMSLGGLHDEAELRGHRRTYIGSMPGRILQAIRRAGVKNPVLMMDEIDKLGRDFRGDPAAALLEILDPEQNRDFRDNYLDIPFDLSKVFFVTTANTLDTVPSPLLDRMEVISLSGYSEEEKLQIAKKYLIPRRLQGAGLNAELLQFPDLSIQHIISQYTREAGVRELERMIGRIASKVAKRFAEGFTEPVKLDQKQVSELLGVEKFRMEKIRESLPSGVSTGLAWTPAGGEILYVEVSLIPQHDELRLTGQLGDVMRESAKAAQTYLWSHAPQLNIDLSIFKESGLHVHVPAGAVPKDGPSAGVAMVAAMASAFTGIPCRTDTAMTGEITLSGIVLPVGGIKEKILAARRAEIHRVILPKENQKDLTRLPEEVAREMQFIFADRIEQVLKEALTEVPRMLKVA